MQVSDIDPKIVEFILDSQAADLHRIIKTFEKQGQKGDFMAKVADDETLVAAYLFKPRSQVMDLDNLPDAFKANVKPFNILGFIRQSDGRVMLDLLGGLPRPFSTVKSVVELKKKLIPESILMFTNHLLRCRGLEKDVNEYDFGEFSEEMRKKERYAQALRKAEGIPGFPGIPGIPGGGGGNPFM